MRLSLILALAALPLLSAPAAADCTADIKEILIRANTTSPFRMVSTVKSATTGDMVMTAEVVPPTGMHSKTETGGQTIEMVFTDGKGWMNMAGTWSELPPEAASQMMNVFDPEVIESMGTIEEAQCLGTVDVEGTSLIAYEYSFAMVGMSSASKMFVDPATSLPVRVESTSEIGGAATDTVVTYEYDPAITVTAPSF